MEEGIEVIVVGNNAGWKKRIHMGKKNNQTFVQIPFHTLIEMIKYKGEAAGIRVVVCEEAIQSKASSIDEDQIPVYGNDVTHTFTGKRIKRGLYRSKWHSNECRYQWSKQYHTKSISMYAKARAME